MNEWMKQITFLSMTLNPKSDYFNSELFSGVDNNSVAADDT